MNPQLSEELKRLSDAEKQAVESFREREEMMREPLLKSFAELNKRTQDDEAEKIVVKQINEMFL